MCPASEVGVGRTPLPNVTWWRGERVLDGGWEVAGPGLVRNTLVIDRITRDWHNSTLTCTASNTHLASPAVASVVVHMFLLPTSVIITNPGPTREGQRTALTCSARGSRPLADLNWSVRGRTLDAVKVGDDLGLTSTSTLLLNVTREEDGTRVVCTATNPAQPDTPLSNTTTLVVHYPPKVLASLGRSIIPDQLKEGDDVYFTCSVKANPPASAITWYHEDTVQVQNVSMGVILSGESLVLQKVSRQRAGQYRCSATNPLATVVSQPVRLRIRYKPECLTSPTTYFIYDKPINVTCTVSAYPSVNYIQWQWNNSNELTKTPPVTESREKASSQLTVFPTEGREDRVLSCWAVNEMGRQVKPCGFSVKVAQMPLPLSSCRLANITASSLSLTCQRPNVATAGTTLYRAEVYFDNRTLFANVTSNRPNFNVSRLDAGTSYQIKVYVSHGPVTSQPVVVSAYTSRTSRTAPGDTSTSEGGVSVGGVVGGLAVTLVLLVGVVVMRNYCRRRRGRRKQEPRPQSDDSNPDVVPNIEETYDLLAPGEPKAEASYDSMNTPMPEDVPMEAYHPLVLQSSSTHESEEFQGSRTDRVYCPVDQLMQAEESVV
ncbi:hemicentin-1-like [Penaeus monodon]|uniref:hemicentin-1-like n=1 Tax=Penaeus monodon TaxID=6687 RepID=UPI0018A702C1|nr:hemicentin-1-like [Penaeus monodon]